MLFRNEIGNKDTKCTQVLVFTNCGFVNFLSLRHSQYHDLLNIFDTFGYPPNENYLFLGDYVDRGRQSLEVICLLFAFKVLFPDQFFVLRGNHEVASINRIYGFYDECRRRYSVKLWKTFSDVFNTLPIAAVVEDRIFCMHGGIPNMKNHPTFSMPDIDSIERPLSDLDGSKIQVDLLWADPTPTIKQAQSGGYPVPLQIGYTTNTARGVSHYFGRDVLEDFLEQFNLDLIVRAHEVVEDGYLFCGTATRPKMCLTLFGAPNYTGAC